MELFLEFNKSIFEYLKSKKFTDGDRILEEFKWISYFFQECYENYEYIISKSYISSNTFKKKFYKKYVLPYINLDSTYCRENIVSHIDMEPLMESFETGFKKYMDSSWRNKIEIKFFKYIKDDFEKFKEIIFENNMNDKIDYKDILRLFTLCICTCLLKQYKNNIINIINNHKKYKNLSPLVNDCELFYSHNLRNVVNTYRYFESEMEKINKLKPCDCEVDYAAFKYKIVNLIKYISVSYDNLSEIIEKFKKLPKEYVKFEYDDIIISLKKDIIEYIDNVLKIQKFNVVNYNITDSVKEWFNSDMNFIFTYNYIKDKIAIIEEKFKNAI